ncbi:response regulator [Leeia oryzae]|uniref:response regulator n=1 Tax=Leeia oryzae TaxID=356662 RepID=UPI00036F126A|nr:response regulator [Leeia oryzae]
MHKLIVVDDEINVLNAIRRELSFLTKAEDSAFKIQLACFTSPLEALLLAQAEHVDLIISDYRMPEMNGVDFLREAKRLQPLAASIILSGQADMTAVLRAINEVGIARYMAKPWDSVELITHVLEVLADVSIKRENIRLADEMRQLIHGFKMEADQLPTQMENIVLGNDALPENSSRHPEKDQ